MKLWDQAESGIELTPLQYLSKHTTQTRRDRADLTSLDTVAGNAG
jgi:hypothetical protein